MKGDRIAYRAGYRYVLHDTYRVQTEIYPAEDVITDYVLLGTTGMLTIMAGYAWDGATNFPDMRQIMRGTLAHDAVYELMRLGYLGPECREAADNLLRSICLEDEMVHVLAQAIYEGAQIGGRPYADPANDKPVLEAP